MLSKVNPVVSDWLGKTAPNLFVPEPKNVWLHSSLPFVQGVEIFSAIRMREKYYSLHDCLDGLCSAGYNHSGDGRELAFSCSDPIPPVAVATDQPAEHVLSRSAGEMRSIRQPSFVHNRQLTIYFPPIVNLHRPFLCSFEC